MYFNFSDFIMYGPRGNSKAAGETWLCIVCGQRNQEVNQEAMRLVCSSFYTVHLCCRCINELPNSVIISSIWDTASFIPIATKLSFPHSCSVCQSVALPPVPESPKTPCDLVLMRYKPEFLLMPQL